MNYFLHYTFNTLFYPLLAVVLVIFLNELRYFFPRTKTVDIEIEMELKEEKVGEIDFERPINIDPYNEANAQIWANLQILSALKYRSAGVLFKQ